MAKLTRRQITEATAPEEHEYPDNYADPDWDDAHIDCRFDQKHLYLDGLCVMCQKPETEEDNAH